jgi:hypothetical protein
MKFAAIRGPRSALDCIEVRASNLQFCLAFILITAGQVFAYPRGVPPLIMRRRAVHA